MSSLSEIYIKKETLETILKALEKNNETGINITVSISDESNEWGNNVSVFKSQTKEQRDQKNNKFYIGNGRVFWTNGKIEKAIKPEVMKTAGQQRFDEKDNGGLPF